MTPRPLSPEEKKQHSYNLGKGIYSGLQLKNILMSPPEEEEEEKFVIKLPKERLQQVKKAELEEHLMNLMEIHKGFKDKSQTHFKFRKENLHKELENAQKRYMEALTHQKTAAFEKEATPHVDAMCLGMLSIIEKIAHETISDGALARSMKNMASPVTNHIPSPHALRENLIDKPLLVSTLASLLLKNNLNKDEPKLGKPSMNVSIRAI